MTPQEYITQFRMGQENYEFSREEFMQAFSKDFLDSFQKLPKLPETNKYGGVPTYTGFKDLVAKFQKKFWAISEQKPGKNLTKALWNAFYAITVLPTRAKYYPDLDEKIRARKSNNPR